MLPEGSITTRQHRLSLHNGDVFGGIVDEGWKKHTFLHPRDSGGVLFQLFEEPSPAT
ncbi:MAG: hypothetical protein IH609_12695 [Dehalococcoidia bacterium]|nr:hypothetical protein [Dehalococcoidia bacterium]